MTSSQIIVLITGANQGIGFETAKTLLVTSSSYHVLVGSRDPSKGAEAVAALETNSIKGTVKTIQIDVTDDSSVDAAASHVESIYGRLDILVNNAGIYSKNPVVRDAARETFAVNVVGSVSVTEAFLPLLRKSSAPRLIFVSSSLGSITQAADPKSPYFRPLGNEYRASKAALSMYIVQYQHKLSPDGFKVFGADPGLVVSNLMSAESQRARGGVEGRVGGERIATVVKGERDADIGRVCGVYGVSPW